MSDWWLYRAYSAEGTLLYVGITKQGMLRMAEHQRSNSMWVDCFHRVEVERFDAEEDVRLAERLAIEEEHPRDNIAHARPPLPPGLPAWELLDPDIRAHAMEHLRTRRAVA